MKKIVSITINNLQSAEQEQQVKNRQIKRVVVTTTSKVIVTGPSSEFTEIEIKADSLC